MNTTSASLLQRLKLPGQQDAWSRFVKLYTPLLQHWARQLRLQESDVADLVQDVFATLVQKLPQFQYDQESSFRGWLRTVAHNKWRNRARDRDPAFQGGQAASLSDVAAPEQADAFSEAEYRHHLVARALQLMQAEFPPRLWKACWEYVVADRPAQEVAAELGIAVGTVYVAKARILTRLRQDLDGLLD